MHGAVRESQEGNGPASPADPTEQQGQQTIIEQETRRTLRHVGLEGDSDSKAPFSNDRDPDHIVLFFIGIAPTSTSRGAKWKLPSCTQTTRLQTSCLLREDLSTYLAFSSSGICSH